MQNATMPTSPVKQSTTSQMPAIDGKAVTKRLQSELMTLMMSNTPGVSAFPDNDNLFKWIGTITGPAETVYEGLTFRLLLKFPSGYPYAAPVVTFESPIFHPNVDEFGNICLDILKDKWSAVLNVQTILLSIQSLLAEPNNASPLNGTAADLWNDPQEFKRALLNKIKQAKK